MMPQHLRRMDFSDVVLYAVSPVVDGRGEWLDKVDAMLAGGVDALQLRFQGMADRAVIDLGKELKARCESHGVFFIVDNRADIAFAVDADGLHLGQTDLPLSTAREILGHEKIIGVSAHSLPEAIRAQKEGADYVSCGPIWATPTKPGTAAVGLDLIDQYKRFIRIPFVVIGGVNESNISRVVDRGATTVAVVRALFNATDPAHVAKELRRQTQRSGARGVLAGGKE